MQPMASCEGEGSQRSRKVTWKMSVEEAEFGRTFFCCGSRRCSLTLPCEQRAHHVGSRERVRNERAYSPDFHMRVGVEVVVARVPGSCRRPPDWAWRRCRGARIPRESRPARVDHSPERRPWLPRLSSHGGCPPRGSGWLKHHDRRVLCGFAPWPIWAGGDSSGPGADTRRGNVHNHRRHTILLNGRTDDKSQRTDTRRARRTPNSH